MFGRKKPDKPKRNHSGNLAQFGLFDIPKDFNPMGESADSDGGESDLEAELAALAGGGGSGGRSKSKPKQGRKQPLSQQELDALVKGSLKEDPVEDEEIDENDPDLLSELQNIAGDDDEDHEPSTGSSPSKESSPQKSPSEEVVNLLTNRLKNYQIVEEDAKAAGEITKAKRYGRAIKTLNDLIKRAKSGVDIDLTDDTIPPEIKIKPKQPQNDDASSPADPSVLSPSRPAPALPTPPDPAPLPDTVTENVTEAKKEIDEELVNMLLGRQKEYKIAALQAKKSGNTENALQFIKIAKIFDHVIEAVKKGEAVDLSDMPPPPAELDLSILGNKIQENETQKESNTEAPADVPAEPDLVTAGSVEEALQQRLEVYKSYEQKAQEEGNSSKARRFGRIVKQYEQAIKANKAGRPFAADELPNPPGFAPIPVPGAETPAAPSDSAPAAPKPAPRIKPTTDQNENNDGAGGQPSKPSPSRISGNKASTSHQEKQVMILLAKQKQFKMAALNAKKTGRNGASQRVPETGQRVR